MVPSRITPKATHICADKMFSRRPSDRPKKQAMPAVKYIASEGFSIASFEDSPRTRFHTSLAPATTAHTTAISRPSRSHRSAPSFMPSRNR